MNYEIDIRRHQCAVTLSGDKNPAHTIENIVMGAQLSSFIELFPEIKDQFIQSIRVGFRAPVFAKDSTNLVYTMKFIKKGENSINHYEVEMKENGKVMMDGSVHTTDNKELFELESKDHIKALLAKGIDVTEVSSLNITEKDVREYYCNILGMSETDYQVYRQKYKEGTIRPTMASFFIPGKIIGLLKNELKKQGCELENTGKKYFYGSSEVEFFADKISASRLKIVGKVPENILQKKKCHIDLFIIGNNGIVAKSRTLALAYS